MATAVPLCEYRLVYLILIYNFYFIFFQLQMLGYDISWAGFNIIEVMSSSKFTYKRIGYLSASQCFHQDTEVCLLVIFACKSIIQEALFLKLFLTWM